MNANTSTAVKQNSLSDTNTCGRCGDNRAVDPDRLVVEFRDRTDSTIQHDTERLCAVCWSRLLSEFGGGDGDV